MFFSLICGTAGRTQELERLLQSVAAQTYRDFELLVIDQNADDRAERILAAFPTAQALRIQSPPGLCRALNLGVRLSGGDVIGFPDDDCRYEDGDLLRKLANLFQANSDWDGVTVPTADDEGRPSIARWHTDPGRLTKGNLGFRGCSTGIFYRRSVVNRLGNFDESMGADISLVNPGSDMDYLHRAVGAGFHIEYQPQLCIRHPQTLPDGLVDDRELRKRYEYGYGEGTIARKYSVPLWYTGFIVLFPVVAGIKHTLWGDIHLARKEWVLCRGRVDGWLQRKHAASAGTDTQSARSDGKRAA